MNSFIIIHNVSQSFKSFKGDYCRCRYCSQTEEMKVKEASETKKEEVFILRPLNHKQLAQMYGVSWLTFQNWIKKVEKEVGKKTGHFYHVSQVRKIFQLFGIPKKINVSVNDVEELFKSEN